MAVNATCWNGQTWESYFGISFFTSPDGSGTDLCIGKTASARSNYGGYPASCANDNNAGTRWATSGNVPTGEWWKIDLVTPAEVHSVKLLGYLGYFNRYEDLQCSNDNVNWTTVTRIETVNTASLQTFTNL